MKRRQGAARRLPTHQPTIHLRPHRHLDRQAILLHPPLEPSQHIRCQPPRSRHETLFGKEPTRRDQTRQTREQTPHLLRKILVDRRFRPYHIRRLPIPEWKASQLRPHAAHRKSRRVITPADTYRLLVSGIKIDKRREGNDDRAIATTVIGEVENKEAIIFDDEVDTAGSLIETAKILEKFNAKEIYAGCTHGILSADAVERIEKSPIKELVITNTVPLTEKKKIDKIKVLTIAPLFAEAIRRINEARPLGELFVLE